MSTHSSRFHAGLAVFLITSAASLGIAARLFMPGTAGAVLFILTRIGILALPFIWSVWIDKNRISGTWPSRKQGLVGVLLGVAMAGMIFSAYWFPGRHLINIQEVRSKAEQVGLLSPTLYLLSAFYFTFINALIEEYIWRWFMCRQWSILLNSFSALYLAPLCFTLHHIIALMAYTGNGIVVAIASFGVFAAGFVWSWLYLTYRSVWACYISHLIADLAIALVGWHILFAAPY